MVDYGIFMPQGGGFLIAAKNVLKKDPEFIFSYEEFKKINLEVIKYYNLESKFKLNPSISDLEQYKGIDMVFIITPCNDLSSHSIKFSAEHTISEEACSLDYLYNTVDLTLKHIKPKFLIGENSDKLFTHAGRYVRDKLNKIVLDNGYSITYIKINAVEYGIPQRRVRTYYVISKTNTPLIFPVIHNIKNYIEFMIELDNKIPKDDYYHNVKRAYDILQNDWYYKFVIKELGPDWRKVKLKKKSLLNIIFKNKKHWDFYNFLIENNQHTLAEQIKYRCLKWDDYLQSRSRKKKFFDNSPQYKDGESRIILSRWVDKIIHPIEERVLTFREMMALQGFPLDLYFTFDPYKSVTRFGFQISKSIPVKVGEKIIENIINENYQLANKGKIAMIDNTSGEVKIL